MKFCVHLTVAIIIPLMMMQTSRTFARELDNIAILPFEGFQGANSKHYEEVLTEKLIIKITQSHRFNVISRKELQELLHEQKLQLSGLFDESTVTKVGHLAGVDFLVVGNFVGNQSKFYSTEYSKSGEKVRDSFYHAKAEASIKLIDLTTGKYLTAVSVDGAGYGRSKEEAILNCIDNLSEVAFTAYESAFVIKCNILNVSDGMIILDQGETTGMEKGMGFLLTPELSLLTGAEFEPLSGINHIGEAIVTEVSPERSIARIISQSAQITPDLKALESKRDIQLSGFVIERDGTRITINLGEDVGLKTWQTFESRSDDKSLTDPISGKKFAIGGKKLSAVIINKVYGQTAEGRIVQGLGKIQAGSQIYQSSLPVKYAGFSLSTGLWVVERTSNFNYGTLNVDGDQINYDFTTVSDLPDMANFFRISYFHKNWKNRTKFNYAYQRIAVGKSLHVAGWDMMVSRPYIFSSFDLKVAPGIGLGRWWAYQTIPGSIVETLSDSKSDHVSSSSWQFLSSIELLKEVGSFSISALIQYSSAHLNSWEYRKAITKTDTEGEEYSSSEIVSIDNRLVPFPELRKPIAFEVGVSYSYPASGKIASKLWGMVDGIFSEI